MARIKLSNPQQQILEALAQGATLKIHRSLDGKKVVKLHLLDGTERLIGRSTVEALKSQGLIDSNKKFPAATYLLTESGKRQIEVVSRSLSARNY